MKRIFWLGMGWLACVVSAGLGAEEVDDFRYQRSIDVDSAGWVGVRLDGEARTRARTELSVLDPSGESVSFFLEGESERRDARVLSAKSVAGGWSLELDLGAQPPRHRRLYFKVEQRIHAPECRLEGSDDRQEWQPLGSGDLFRFGRNTDFQQQALDYQPSRHRYLRLIWPGGAQPPKLDQVQVATVSREGDQETLDSSCQPMDGGAECELALPRASAWIERLDLVLEGSPPLGFRLWVGEDGRWKPYQQGVRRSTEAVRIAVEPEALSGRRQLRLEIYGSVAGLERAQAWLTRPSLTFEAEREGRHLLVYGRAMPVKTRQANGSSSQPIAWLELGEEIAGARPAWPERWVSPQVMLPSAEFDRRWPVTVDAAPGDLVRLQLPTAVSSSVRLAHGDLQVPFQRIQRHEPQLDERVRAEPESLGDGSSEAKAVFNSPAAQGAIQFFATGPFERRWTGSWQERTRPGVDGGVTAGLPRQWTCNENPPLPCVLTSSGPYREVNELSLSIDDGDNPPLSSIRVERWSAREELWFVWPGEPVVLYAGGGLPAPRYDFAGLEPILRHRAASVAAVGVTEPLANQADLPPWALWLVLGLAAVVLLWQLNKVVRAES